MALAREIKAILPDATLLVGESTLSYVKYLMPRSKSNKMLLLHRESQSENLLQRATVLDDPESSEFDITGSPLKYELCYPEVDKTVSYHRNLKEEEEFHSPLAKLEACVALNCCLEHLSNKDWSMPLVAICDGKDNDKTVLLGSYIDIEAGWYTTIQGRVMEPKRLSNIEQIPSILLKEYTNTFSIQQHKVSTTVSSTYELCGKRPEVTDLFCFSPGSFDGNLSIKVNSNTPSFYAPIRASTTTLFMEIIAGRIGSHLNKLWNELTFLHQHLNMLEGCEPNEHNSQTFDLSNSVTWDKIKEKLNFLLNGENEDKSCKYDDDDDHRDVADDIKLKKHIDNVQFRQNMDFADMLWELLMSCADYAQMISCIRMVLQKVQSGLTTPQINPTNSARISKLISEILFNNAAVPKLTENLLLELLIDTGLEKLGRDYTCIMLSANLIDSHDIRQTLCTAREGSFDIESYRKKLTSLAQIHLCLEFTVFAQNYLHFQTANLHSIFIYAFQEYVLKKSAFKSFSDLHENQIQSLNVPLPTVSVKHIVQGVPTSWCLTLSSESNTSTITTTSHLSRTPILPPNIYCFDKSSEHEVYHCLKINALAVKMA